QCPSPDGDGRPAPCLGTLKRVPGLVAPPFAQLAFGDAGDPGALTQGFSVPVVQAQRPALVAGAATWGRWWASTLFVLSTGAALSKFDSALADRGPRTRPPLSKFDSPLSPPGDLGRHAAGYPEPYSYLRSAPFRPGRLRRCGRPGGAHRAVPDPYAPSAQAGPRRQFGDRLRLVGSQVRGGGPTGTLQSAHEPAATGSLPKTVVPRRSGELAPQRVDDLRGHAVAPSILGPPGRQPPVRISWSRTVNG